VIELALLVVALWLLFSSEPDDPDAFS